MYKHSVMLHERMNQLDGCGDVSLVNPSSDVTSEDDSVGNNSVDAESVGDASAEDNRAERSCRNVSAEEVEAERFYAAEISSRPGGDVLVEISATEVDSCDARDVTQKEDGGIVATATTETVGNTSSGSAYASTPALYVD